MRMLASTKMVEGGAMWEARRAWEGPMDRSRTPETMALMDWSITDLYSVEEGMNSEMPV